MAQQYFSDTLMWPMHHSSVVTMRKRSKTLAAPRMVQHFHSLDVTYIYSLCITPLCKPVVVVVVG